MHKIRGGEEGCRSLPPPPAPFPLHSAPNPPPRLFPREGDKIQSLQVAGGEREQLQQRLVCHDGCRHLGHRHLDFHSTWKTPTPGRVTLSSDSNGQEESWCADWNICAAPLLYSWWSLQRWELKPELISLGSENFPLSRAISPSDALGKNKAFCSMFDNSCKEVYSCVDINLRFKPHLHSQDRKLDKMSFLWCKCCPRNLHFSWEWWPCKWEHSSSLL